MAVIRYDVKRGQKKDAKPEPKQEAKFCPRNRKGGVFCDFSAGRKRVNDAACPVFTKQAGAKRIALHRGKTVIRPAEQEKQKERNRRVKKNRTHPDAAHVVIENPHAQKERRKIAQDCKENENPPKQKQVKHPKRERGGDVRKKQSDRPFKGGIFIKPPLLREICHRVKEHRKNRAEGKKRIHARQKPKVFCKAFITWQSGQRINAQAKGKTENKFAAKREKTNRRRLFSRLEQNALRADFRL